MHAWYVTLLFDGWENVNGQVAVNVLLQTESTIKSGRRIFLNTIYTGAKSVTATAYQAELDAVMKQLGRHGTIFAVTSYNTTSCLNAIRYYAESFHGVVSINDEAHVADLLMNDYFKISSIK